MKFKLAYFGDGIEKTRYHAKRREESSISRCSLPIHSLINVVSILNEHDRKVRDLSSEEWSSLPSSASASASPVALLSLSSFLAERRKKSVISISIIIESTQSLSSERKKNSISQAMFSSCLIVDLDSIMIISSSLFLFLLRWLKIEFDRLMHLEV